MRTFIFSFPLAFFLAAAAAPASADQGCIEYSTTTVTTTVCEQFDCVQQSDDGNCVQWNCDRTQTTNYTDVNTSGCTRVANCGKKALFMPGAPVDGDRDSTEQCDWYPCVQADPVTHACVASMCVSKRVFQTVRAAYPDAICVPLRTFQAPPPKQQPKPAASRPAAPAHVTLGEFVPQLQ
jgi:hypothetical protein